MNPTIMQLEVIEYKGFTIAKRTDIETANATIYNGVVLFKMIAGDIAKDLTNNAIDKAKKFIDSI